MAWMNPPTWTNGETLGATKLNQLSDAAMFLNGLGGQPAAVGLVQVATATTSYVFWCNRHRHRYLQVRYWTDGGDEINVYYNGVKVFYDNDPDNGEQWLRQGGVASGYLDLDGVAGMVAYGQPYELTIEVKPLAGGKTIKLRQVCESNVASL